MSIRDIEKTLKEIYGVKINKDDITKLISVVSEETESWRKRKLIQIINLKEWKYWKLLKN